MTFMNVKRTGRVGVPYRGRLYSPSWTVDNTLTVTWHHIEKSAQLRGYEDDPKQLARKLLREIVKTVSPLK